MSDECRINQFGIPGEEEDDEYTGCRCTHMATVAISFADRHISPRLLC